MGTMDDQIRKIVREEIARALSAAGEVADGALSNDPYQDTDVEDTALGAINKVMERVARDVLANTHPVLSTEHTASTEPVHTITAVPERPKAACTCHRHTHVMGHDDRCGAPFCYCLSPVRARPEHTAVHTSTESLDYNRACTVCEHGEHDRGKCGMHVYLRGVPSPCPCLASRTLGAQASTRPSTVPCSCPGGHRRAVNGQCQMCGHKAHNPAGCTGGWAFE